MKLTTQLPSALAGSDVNTCKGKIIGLFVQQKTSAGPTVLYSRSQLVCWTHTPTMLCHLKTSRNLLDCVKEIDHCARSYYCMLHTTIIIEVSQPQFSVFEWQIIWNQSFSSDNIEQNCRKFSQRAGPPSGICEHSWSPGHFWRGNCNDGSPGYSSLKCSCSQDLYPNSSNCKGNCWQQ
jgi:hypothetical protein